MFGLEGVSSYQKLVKQIATTVHLAKAIKQTTLTVMAVTTVQTKATQSKQHQTTGCWEQYRQCIY